MSRQAGGPLWPARLVVTWPHGHKQPPEYQDRGLMFDARRVAVRIKRKLRTLYIPNKTRKRRLRAALAWLTPLAIKADPMRVAHGFLPGRSPVTNARPHIPYRYTLSMDIQDCFGSIRQHTAVFLLQKVLGYTIEGGVQELLFADGIVPQGFPTSPALCNIALAPADIAIASSLRGDGAYTRYADDLTISANSIHRIEQAQVTAEKTLGALHLSIAKHKTRLQDARGGRRIITGIGVDANGLHPTRRMRRLLRAARHQKRWSVARGYAEWMALKSPSVLRAIAAAMKRRRYAARWRQFIADMLFYDFK